MKLSFKDKCWLVANIKRVFLTPAGIISFTALMIYSNHKDSLPSFYDIVGFLGVVVLTVTAFYAMKYANKIGQFAEANFEEVISRQAKWRNSNVDLHEMKYKFKWETFGWAFFCLYAPVFSTVWLIGYYINT